MQSGDGDVQTEDKRRENDARLLQIKGRLESRFGLRAQRDDHPV